MSRFKSVFVVLFAAAVLAPAAHAQSAVRAVVKFSPGVAKSQRVTTVRSAGGQVLKVRGTRVVARMSSRAADQLRTAMGVVSVTIR
ncbi:MAG: hypothetical protein QOI80_3857 [Solirubrobacteraceae bacterium]|nr:hypothetical protein [Solirubrobacteraceae bacterium]